MLPQERLIARVRQLCQDDERLVAALTYGSFAQGSADAHSDIEFWLFSETPVDTRAWLAGIGPIGHVVVNEFGAHVVFFPGLIRGEFHFATNIDAVRTWPARGAASDRMIVLDRTGALREALDALPAAASPPATPEAIGELCGRFANWLLLAHHVARRGELLRALDALTYAQRHLLWMTRLTENSTHHWLTPSRSAERDLSPSALLALHRTAATADPHAISEAITAAWTHGSRCWRRLATHTGFPIPEPLFTELDAALIRPPAGH
ncbi:hypothetical protein [Actinoplanes solisilvae]|uniref:hypothetical protein n=1 Tax=Actinoplanes solisilvae TaxID=2486853 RepID=UPI000FD72542|nr:hypothetical protein [Actinoplanes solisilvae]